VSRRSLQAPNGLRLSSHAKYPDAEAPLKNHQRRRAIADELKRDGFNVEIGENLTGDAMRRAFDKLYGRSSPARSR